MTKFLYARIPHSVAAVEEWGEEKTHDILLKQLAEIDKEARKLRHIKEPVSTWELVRQYHPERYNEEGQYYYDDETVWEFQYKRLYEMSDELDDAI